jgi:hypothetical protein
MRGMLPIAFVIALIALLVPAGASVSAQETTPPPKPPIPTIPTIPTLPELPSTPEVPEVPEVPKDPSELTDMVSGLGSKMMLTPQKRVARGLPATLKFNGWVMPPMRLNKVDGFFERTFGIDLGVCRGPVFVTYRSGGKAIAMERVSVNRMCAFTSGITIRSRGELGPGGRVRATARFRGNSLLGPAQHSVAVRVG